MKRRYYFALAGAGLAIGAYLYLRGGGWPGSLFPSGLGSSGGDGVYAANRWHKVERPGDGFKVDLPGETKDLQAPAYNQTGGSEPVHMLVANASGDVTYAITWEDNPPVARAGHSIDHTLSMARDGMLARTETTIQSESRGFHREYPSLDVLARNAAGGVLNARLIMAEDRLYVLLALFPSAGARREREVNRFFDSFVPARPGGIPETVPTASQQ